MALPDAEPARQEEGERLDLRPKSFVEAAEEEVAVDAKAAANASVLTNGRKKGGVDGGYGEEKVAGGDERVEKIERDRSGKDDGELGKREGQGRGPVSVEGVQKSYAAAVSTSNVQTGQNLDPN